MTNKKIAVTVACMALTATQNICAQTLNGLQGESEYRYNNATQLWRNTGNMAGLTLDSTVNRGFAAFTVNHRGASFHRVQEGSMANNLNFSTERYQRMGKYLYGYGRFDFNNGRTKERAWADVMRPYNANPYFAGSAIKGRYDHQDIDLQAGVGTVNFGPWRFGVGVDYKVGDLSRLRDPRSRSQLLDYRVAPAFTFDLGRHTLGLAGHYNRRKEKIDNVTTVQTNATTMYYLMSGMENAVGTAGGYKGFGREWVNHALGAELTYAFRNRRMHSVNALSVERGSESVYGQYKYEPGHYYTYRYGLKSQNRIESKRLLQAIDLTVGYEQGYADEYRQQLNITTDSLTGYSSYHYITLLKFNKRFQVNLFNLDLHYRLNVKQARAIAGYVGLQGRVQTTRNKYVLDFSEFKYSSMDWTLESGKNFLGGRLWIDASATLHSRLKNSIVLADATTDYAVNVLLPDRTYYNSNYAQGHLQALYQFPMTLKKVRSMWYVKVFGDYLHTNTHLHSSAFGLSVGIFN